MSRTPGQGDPTTRLFEARTQGTSIDTRGTRPVDYAVGGKARERQPLALGLPRAPQFGFFGVEGGPEPGMRDRITSLSTITEFQNALDRDIKT